VVVATAVPSRSAIQFGFRSRPVRTHEGTNGRTRPSAAAQTSDPCCEQGVRFFQDRHARYLISISASGFPHFFLSLSCPVIGRDRFEQMAAAWAVLAAVLVAAQVASAAPVTAPAFLWAPKNYGWVPRCAYRFPSLG
jgi:hypothetical protein